MKTCSILIPTRKRVPRLIKTIESIVATSSDDNVEILLRIDGDDFETIESIPALMRLHPDVVVLIGRRLGYGGLDEYYNEMVRACSGKWFFIMNDDITLEGDEWDERLKLISTSNLAIPEFYTLGNSGWGDFGCGYVCPIVPTSVFKSHGPMGNPVDVWWMERYGGGFEAKQNTVIVPGLRVNHQRDNDHDLERHRNG